MLPAPWLCFSLAPIPRIYPATPTNPEGPKTSAQGARGVWRTD
jgi:hypothetical protein